ncbi:MAG TPA: bacitracin resistance protein [Galbitalea sp.]|jgi:hypothetical protein|nr:bacitracin resistance protein [Galbitalea sp.]
MTTETEIPAAPWRYGWPSVLVAAVFGILYAYVLWQAVEDLIQLPAQFGSVTPWWLLILDIVVPVAAFVVAFFVGRRRSLGGRALLFLVGLALVACSTVSSISFFYTHFFIA